MHFHLWFTCDFTCGLLKTVNNQTILFLHTFYSCGYVCVRNSYKHTFSFYKRNIKHVHLNKAIPIKKKKTTLAQLDLEHKQVDSEKI